MTSVTSVTGSVAELSSTFSGQLLGPTDVGYEEARRIAHRQVSWRRRRRRRHQSHGSCAIPSTASLVCPSGIPLRSGTQPPRLIKAGPGAVSLFYLAKDCVPN